MDGILLIDKPSGFTSHDVVAKVRGVLGEASSQQSKVVSQKILTTNDSQLSTASPKVKVGHTGTLDPMATGLLILVLGKYTKKAEQFSKLDKIYEAELTLGQTSSTGDREGEIVQKSAHQPSLEELQKVLNKFVGEISQVPPAFSAIKVDGQRAYKLARAGKKPELKPRQVTVYRLEVTDYRYPVLRFITEVSSGTYIRTLAEDIGENLGSGAYLSALRRTRISNYSISDAVPLDKIDISSLNENLLSR